MADIASKLNGPGISAVDLARPSRTGGPAAPSGTESFAKVLREGMGQRHPECSHSDKETHSKAQPPSPRLAASGKHSPQPNRAAGGSPADRGDPDARRQAAGGEESEAAGQAADDGPKTVGPSAKTAHARKQAKESETTAPSGPTIDVGTAQLSAVDPAAAQAGAPVPPVAAEPSSKGDDQPEAAAAGTAEVVAVATSVAQPGVTTATPRGSPIEPTDGKAEQATGPADGPVDQDLQSAAPRSQRPSDDVEAARAAIRGDTEPAAKPDGTPASPQTPGGVAVSEPQGREASDHRGEAGAAAPAGQDARGGMAFRPNPVPSAPQPTEAGAPRQSEPGAPRQSAPDAPVDPSPNATAGPLHSENGGTLRAASDLPQSAPSSGAAGPSMTPVAPTVASGHATPAGSLPAQAPTQPPAVAPAANGAGPPVGGSVGVVGASSVHPALSLHASTWPDDLGGRVMWLLDHKASTADLRLDPPELGSMRIRIALDNDATKVHFAVQTAVARDAVESAMPRLRALFQQAGINLLNVDVTAHQNTSGQGGAQSGFAQEWSGARSGQGIGSLGVAPAVARPPVHPSERVLDAYA
jgi:flagellar hook-length control protein FliK